MIFLNMHMIVKSKCSLIADNLLTNEKSIRKNNLPRMLIYQIMQLRFFLLQLYLLFQHVRYLHLVQLIFYGSPHSHDLNGVAL